MSRKWAQEGLHCKGPGETGPGEQGRVPGGTPWGCLPAALVQDWPRGRTVVWWQQHPWPRVKIVALVTQGRMAAQTRLIVSRNYGDIVPPKITCKG